jgi:hypothetical protein
MATHDTMNGEELLFKVGDGATPEAFTHPCSINTDRKVDFSSDIYSVAVGDCANPGGPKVMKRRIKGKDIKVTGAGLGEPASVKLLLQKWDAGAAFNGKLMQDLAANGWTVTAPWVIESLSVGGMDGELQNFDITLSIADEYDLAFS